MTLLHRDVCLDSEILPMSNDFKIAVIATVYRARSHADVIVSRWLEPRPADRDWGWDTPRSRIASLYVAQLPENDLAREKSAQYGVPLYATVRDALTLGGDTLAVDGVLLIGEHGDYPHNALGQHLYPRKELFDAIVAVFRESGRVVPLFCDKHLSWNGDWAREMVATAKALRIPFLSGSSLPHVGVEPDLEILPGSEIEEYVGLFGCEPEAYGIHSLELMQSLIETRQGGETGIRSVCAYAEDGVWEAMAQGKWSETLFQAALDAARNVREGDIRANCRPQAAFATHLRPVAFCLEYVDGLRAAHIMLEGHLSDFTVAVRLKGDSRIQAACSRITAGDESNHFAHFATLDRVIEDTFLTGTPSIPIERALLTTCAIAACMNALQTPGQPLETPELQLAYQAAILPHYVTNRVQLPPHQVLQ